MTVSERLERIWPSLVALVGTVAVVVGLLVLFGGDVDDSTPDDVAADSEGGGADGGDQTDPSDTPPATEPPPTDEPTADPTGDPTDPPATDPPATKAPEELREPVGIANQTSVGGLAAFAEQRIEEGGWEVAATGDFNGTVPETTVYYPDGMQEAAEALAAQFPEIGRVEPSFEGLNQSRLVVILVDDYVDEVGAPE